MYELLEQSVEQSVEPEMKIEQLLVAVLERAHKIRGLVCPSMDKHVEHVVNHAAPLGRHVPQSLEMPHALRHRP